MSFFHIISTALLSTILCGCQTGVDPEALPHSPATVETNPVTMAVRHDLPELLAKIPSDRLGDYGFNSVYELRQVEIAAPLPVRVISYNQLKTKPKTRPKIQSTSVWRVPLLINHEWRALATVEKDGDKYKLVDFGASRLARGLQKTSASIPSNTTDVYLLRDLISRHDYLGYIKYDNTHQYIKVTIPTRQQSLHLPRNEDARLSSPI